MVLRLMTDHLEQEEFKSKTAIKKEMLELQKLGVALIDLPPAIYKTFPIPDQLDDAIAVAKKITSNNAKKRQMQYIGKIMREIDTEAIEKAFFEYQNGRKKEARHFQALESFRLQLIEGNDQLLNNILEANPHCDRQQLMQLIRGARKEQQAQTNGKNFKKLFSFLKELSPWESA